MQDQLCLESNGENVIDAAKETMMKILAVFIEVCERHNLRYTMIGGSLLGAVRHKGFIPWDDDIDVAMPREDYERFISVAQDELPENYFLQTSATDPEHLWGFAKIRRIDTAAILKNNVERLARVCQGIFIDIFPLEGVPNCAEKRRNVIKTLRFLKMLQANAVRYKFSSWRNHLKCIFARCVVRLVGVKTLFLLRERVLRRNNCKNCFECTISPSEWNFSERFRWPFDMFDDMIKSPFENLMVNIPRRFDECLSVSYGDWHVPVKGAAEHTGLDFSVTKDYKTLLCEKYGYTMEMFIKVNIPGKWLCA